MTTRPGLGDILVEERLIAREQLNQARRAAERLGSPLASVLLEQGLVTEDALVDALVRRLQLEVYDPTRTMVDLDAIREVPFEEANRYRLLPIQLSHRGTQRVLRVAMVDPLDAQAIEDIEFSTASTVEPLIARPSHLAEAIRHHYRGVVTKVIQRSRGEANPAPELHRAARSGRRPFGGDLDNGLRTRPLTRIDPDATAVSRLNALVALLVRKGYITAEEYEEDLRAMLTVESEEAR